jgi:hypothetical protein
MDETKPSGVTRRSILIGVGILVVSLAAQACITFFGTLRKGRSASITDSDGVVREMPLDTNGRTEVTTALGSNTIEVADGQIRVVDATCTNKDCVHQGPISRPGQTIVCLPNRLVIRIEGSDDESGGSGEDGDRDSDGTGDSGGSNGGGGSDDGGSNPNRDTPPDVDAIAG